MGTSAGGGKKKENYRTIEIETIEKWTIELSNDIEYRIDIVSKFKIHYRPKSKLCTHACVGVRAHTQVSERVQDNHNTYFVDSEQQKLGGGDMLL